jgi:carbonic anhydrase
MDSRSIPEIVFDQTVADIFTLRIAGNVVNQDILASLEYATKHSGAKVIVIMGHTQCGAIEAVCKGGLKGNLESLARAIQPAVAMLQKQSPNKQLDCNDEVMIKNIAMQNVRNMMTRVIKGSTVIKELISQGSVKLIGALHDLNSGVVTFEMDGL